MKIFTWRGTFIASIMVAALIYTLPTLFSNCWPYKKINLGLRIFLGIALVIFGLAKFIEFMPQPELNEEAGALMGAFVKSGYIMAIVGIVELVVGLLLLANKYVALALVVLFPILLTAFLFHAFLDIAGVAGSLVLTGLNVYLMFVNKDKYAGMLQAN